MAYGARRTSGNEPEEDRGIGDLKGEAKLQRFKEWLRLSTDADSKQREREREDLRFQVAENQWPDAAKNERQGRPMLSISLLHQPLQLVQNQAEAARLGVKLEPVNEKATSELAEVKQGLYQRIQRDGLADQARLWALDRAKQCGRGWYRVNTKWDEDSDNPSDQEIVYERILYQEMVYPDPAAQKPDYSDARFIFLTAYVPYHAFRELYPGAEYASTQDFADMAVESPEWVRGKDPMVAELFYKVTTFEKVQIGKFERTREVTKVYRAVISGCEVLEDDEWIGSYIPIIPVIGRELQPVDGERRWEGMVRPARDGQMTFNYAISSLVEDISRLSKAPYVGAEGQFEGHEKEWLESNRRNFPYLEYKNITLGGQPVPPPQPMQVDGTKMGLSLQLAQEAKGLVQVATAVYEPSLGQLTPGEKGQSGRAIIALQQQADAGTGNYLGNLGKISLPYEARVVLDLIPKIYDRPGRVTQVLGGEDETRTVILNAPFVLDAEGNPVPAKPGTPDAKVYDLTQGKYSIATSIGKSAQTRLQQGADEIGQILTADPGMMSVIGDIYFRFRDFPGHTEIADRLAKLREKVNPGLAEGKDGQPSPEQLAAQNQALQAQVQQMQAELMAAAEAIKTEQAKQQATLAKAEMDAAAKQQAAETAATAALSKAQMEEAARMALEKFRAAHETALQEMQQRFERELAEFKAAHEVAMAAAGGRTARMVRDQGQETGEESAPEVQD